MILLQPLMLMAAPAEGSNPLLGLAPVLIMVAIFYFLLIAPVRKRQKQHDAMLENLKHGDRVVTTGGLYGTVVGIQEDRIRLKISDQVKVDVQKQGIAALDESTE